MAASALPLIFYARLILHGRRALENERQIGTFLSILAIAIGVVTLWNVVQGVPFGPALRQSAFNVTSILTDTGFVTADYSTWGGFAVGVFFILLFIGGCAGSTAGAIKIFRWQILVSAARRQLQGMAWPHRVLVVSYAGRPVTPDKLASVRNFFFLYLLTFTALSLMVMATGLDFLSSSSAVAEAMAGAGPGLGPVGGPVGNFADFPGVAKWILSSAMLLGRLELSTVYVLIFGNYWRS